MPGAEFELQIGTDHFGPLAPPTRASLQAVTRPTPLVAAVMMTVRPD